MYILILGSITVGHRFYGPFESFDAAYREGRAHREGSSIVKLEQPVTQPKPAVLEN